MAVVIPCIEDAFADPQNDLCNPLRYITSNGLTAVAMGLFFCIGTAQTWLAVRYRVKYMFIMVIGCFTMCLGLSLRFGLHNSPRSTGLYISQYLLVVLSPCAFIAATYILLGRLVRYADGDEYLPVRSSYITVVFLFSDITTFLVQAAGGGILASATTSETSLLGSRVLLAGLSGQLLSYAIFSLLLLLSICGVYNKRREVWRRDTGKAWYNDWRSFAAALWISSTGILMRSTFRAVELSDGYTSPLATSERLFYCLDILPLLIATSIFIPFWPGRLVASTPPCKIAS